MPTIIDGLTGVNKVVDGSIVQADLSTNVVANGPVFIAFKTNTISVVGNNTVVVATGYTETYDPTNSFDSTTGRFQPTVAGYYQVNAVGQFGVSSRTAGVLACYVCMNSGNTVMFSSCQSSSGGFPTVGCTGIVYLNGTTDYITAGIGQNSGSTYTDVGIQHFYANLVRAA